MKRERWNGVKKLLFLMFENPQIRQMNWLKMFRKKSLSDEFFLCFFFETSESDRFSIIYMIRIRFFGLGELIQRRFQAAQCAELLKDLRGLRKPPSFDGNDAENQDIRFSFRINMSLVSTVSLEVERNPISLAAVQALGDAHLKCCIQMFCSLALITKGSVRTLVRSVEESNGAEAWRLLIQRRDTPETQNRQYPLMQKIMMLAKLWCDHAEGCQSGLRAWELDVGEWERASGTTLADAVKYTVMMNMAPIFLRNNLQVSARNGKRRG